MLAASNNYNKAIKIDNQSINLTSCFLFSELCPGKAIVAYTKPQQWKKEESGRLKGARDQIKFIDLEFERWQVVRFRKARRR